MLPQWMSRQDLFNAFNYDLGPIGPLAPTRGISREYDRHGYQDRPVPVPDRSRQLLLRQPGHAGRSSERVSLTRGELWSELGQYPMGTGRYLCERGVSPVSSGRLSDREGNIRSRYGCGWALPIPSSWPNCGKGSLNDLQWADLDVCPRGRLSTSASQPMDSRVFYGSGISADVVVKSCPTASTSRAEDFRSS